MGGPKSALLVQAGRAICEPQCGPLFRSQPLDQSWPLIVALCALIATDRHSNSVHDMSAFTGLRHMKIYRINQSTGTLGLFMCNKYLSTQPNWIHAQKPVIEGNIDRRRSPEAPDQPQRWMKCLRKGTRSIISVHGVYLHCNSQAASTAAGALVLGWK